MRRPGPLPAGVKQLYLLRHAKSDWSNPALTDHDRPLNKRGKKAAALISAYMADHGLKPDMVWCSTATRARETLIRWYDGQLATPPVEYRKILYLAGVDRLLAALSQTEEVHDRVMMIGHNPGFHQFAQLLTGAGAPELRDQLEVKYPTAALAVVELAIDHWRDAAFGQGALTHFVTPKSLIS